MNRNWSAQIPQLEEHVSHVQRLCPHRSSPGLESNLHVISRLSHVLSNKAMKIKPCQKANHDHVFWDRTGLAHHWETVRDSMEKVLKIKFDFCFQVLYLGIMPKQIFDFSKAYMYRITLVGSKKKAITKRWRSKGSPSLAGLMWCMTFLQWTN